ncbi:hypothetical protein FRC19_007568 [Serendipita sp. 401]|nr:hypothetical protein FRC19_007568 [Serendipita sp. 401]KAG9020423.1 hypothetical protein FS842_007337 [Serendipita sp. 407]
MSQKQWTVDDMVSMKGKTVVITGANTGIGYVACKAMLQHDAKVYMMARDSQKSHDAIKRMKQETGKEAIELIPLDLADLRGVRKAAEIFLRYVIAHT